MSFSDMKFEDRKIAKINQLLISSHDALVDKDLKRYQELQAKQQREAFDVSDLKNPERE